MPPAENRTGQPSLPKNCYHLRERQGPRQCKVAIPGKDKEKEKDRRFIEPPPVIQLTILDHNDPASNYLQSPYYFMVCALWHETEDRAVPDGPDGSPSLTGQLVSSLHRIKDPAENNIDCGVFAFGDLSCTLEGRFRLKCVLFEIMSNAAVPITEHFFQPFEVQGARAFPGYEPSTNFTRQLYDCGVRLRNRKETPKQAQAKRAAESQQQPYPGQEQAYGPRPGMAMPLPLRGSGSESQGSSYTGSLPHMYDEPDSKRPRIPGPFPMVHGYGQPGQVLPGPHMFAPPPASASTSSNTYATSQASDSNGQQQPQTAQYPSGAVAAPAWGYMPGQQHPMGQPAMYHNYRAVPMPGYGWYYPQQPPSDQAYDPHRGYAQQAGAMAQPAHLPGQRTPPPIQSQTSTSQQRPGSVQHPGSHPQHLHSQSNGTHPSPSPLHPSQNPGQRM